MDINLDELFAVEFQEASKPKRKSGEFKLIEPANANLKSYEVNKLKQSRFHNVDDFVWDLLETGKVFLAGGALRTIIDPEDTVCDYDLFFYNLDDVNAIKDMIMEYDFNLYYSCPENKLFSYIRSYDDGEPTKVQLICEQAYDSPIDCISQFDFGACAAALTKDKFYCYDMFINNVRSKIITMLDLPFPLATFKRAAKYAAKGYNIGYFAEQFIWEVRMMPQELLVEGGAMRRYID
jgi:hypothetical protein